MSDSDKDVIAKIDRPMVKIIDPAPEVLDVLQRLRLCRDQFGRAFLAAEVDVEVGFGHGHSAEGWIRWHRDKRLVRIREMDGSVGVLSMDAAFGAREQIESRGGAV